MLKTSEGDCYALTQDSTDVQANYILSLERDDNTFIRIQYKPREPNYVFSVQLTCNQSADSYFDDVAIDATDKIFLVKAQSKTGCKVDEVNGFFIWVDLNKWFIFPVFLILGAVVCFAGKHYLRYLIFLSGVIEASFLIILICYSTFASEND